MRTMEKEAHADATAAWGRRRVLGAWAALGLAVGLGSGCNVLIGLTEVPAPEGDDASVDATMEGAAPGDDASSD